MTTGIVSNSILCLPLLHYLQSAKENFCVFSAEQVVNDKGAVASFCAGAGISCVHEKSSGQSLYDWVSSQQPHIVFVIGYDRVIKLNRFDGAMPHFYNVHFGHLPEYRGPNPVFWQLKNGASSLAITVHRISKQLDAGDVVWKKEYTNEPFFSYGYVHQLMSHFLVEGVDHLLKQHHRQLTVTGLAQDEQQVAYYGRPAAQDVCICWKTMSVAAICNLIKACNPWNNGAVTAYNGFELRIMDAEPVMSNEQSSHPPGTILETSGSFLVSCINSEILHIHSLMVNGVLMPGRFAANFGFIKGQSFNNF